MAECRRKAFRILIVEDDLLIGQLLTEMLHHLGHSICGVATTETAAVAAALQDRPDLMIVDDRLVAGTGLGAVETIAHTVAIPHILMSGNRRHTPYEDAVVLLKPFKQHDIVRAIERTMNLAAPPVGQRHGLPA